MTEPTWANVHYPPIDYQDIIYYAAPKSKKDGPKSLDEVDPELLKTYEKLGIPLQEREILAGVAVDAVFDSVSVATTFKAKLKDMGIIFGSFSEAVQEHPDLVQQVPRLGGPDVRQFLRGAEFGGLQRRLLLLRPQGRALPHGAVHLLPHQRQGHRPVRAHPDRGRRGRLRQLPGRLHRAHARHQPAARRGGGTGGAGQCPDQVFHRAELVSRRQGRQGRHLQFRHQARRLPRREFQDLLDAGGDRLGHHLEVSELPADRRQLGGRVLLRGADQQLPAGRHRHQDDPHREEHHQHDRLQGHLGRPRAEHLSRRREDSEVGARARATTRSAIRCCWATSAARTRSRTWK